MNATVQATITLQGQWKVDGTVEAHGVQLPSGPAIFIPTNEDGGVYVTREQALSFFNLADPNKSIDTNVLVNQLRPYADPDCRDCDGSGLYMGNVLVCGCLLDSLPVLQPEKKA